MNIEHKKTALGDDSILYQKKHDTVDKDYMKNMSTKGKLRYFVDYYLKYVIIAIVLLLVAGNILNITVFNRGGNILSVTFLNDSYISGDSSLHDDLREFLQLENKNDDVVVNNMNLHDQQMTMVFQTRLAVNQLDILVCPQEYFEAAAAQGILFDLSEFLPQDVYERYKDRILMAPKATELDEQGMPVSYGEDQPFGLDFSGSKVFTKYGGQDVHPVLCVAVNTEHKDRILQAFQFLIEEK